MQQMWNRLQLLFAHGVSTLVGNDKVQAKVLDGEVLDNLARVEPYGFSYHPQPGSQSYLLFPSGDRSYGVAIMVGDKRYQMDLQSGEVSLHDDIGHSITLMRGGIAVAGGGHDVTVTGAPTVVVTGGDVVADGVSLKNHVHSGVQPGSGLSGPPVGGGSGGSGGGGGGGVTQGDLDNAVNAAEASAVAALAAELAAVTAKNNAISAKVDAELAKADALLASAVAEGWADTASTLATNAANSATAAGNSAAASSTSASDATTAATAAGTSASQASTSATNAANSASSAGNSATAASNSASSASTSATAAGTSASEASTSASNAASSATAAGNSATAANSHKDTAQSYATAAGDSASLASTHATNAASSQTAAGTSASAAATHASSASTSATNAANSAAAAAIDYSTLSTTVGGHTTDITELISTQNGLTARYGVTINNNGHVSGFALNSDAAENGGAPTSAFVIQADKFAIVDPSVPYTEGNSPVSAKVPFKVTGGVTYIKEAAIEELTVGTEKIKFNAATVAESVSPTSYPFTLAATNLGAFDHTNVASMALSVSDQASKRLILFGFQLSHAESDPGYVQVFIRKSTDTPWTSSGFTIDASTRIIEGTSDQSYLVMKDISVAANENVSVVIDVRFGNGNATHEWSISSDAWFYHMKLFAFTGKR